MALGFNVGLTVDLTRGLYVRFGLGVAVGRGINSGKIGLTTLGFTARGLGSVLAVGPLPFFPSIIIWPSLV